MIYMEYDTAYNIYLSAEKGWGGERLIERNENKSNF